MCGCRSVCAIDTQQHPQQMCGISFISWMSLSGCFRDFTISWLQGEGHWCKQFWCSSSARASEICRGCAGSQSGKSVMAIGLQLHMLATKSSWNRWHVTLSNLLQCSPLDKGTRLKPLNVPQAQAQIHVWLPWSHFNKLAVGKLRVVITLSKL